MLARKHEFGVSIFLDRNQRELERILWGEELTAPLQEMGGGKFSQQVSVRHSGFKSDPLTIYSEDAEKLEVVTGTQGRYVLERDQTVRAEYKANKKLNIHNTSTVF